MHTRTASAAQILANLAGKGIYVPAFLAAALGSASHTSAQTWISTSPDTQLWSNTANWSSGAAPVSSPGTSLTLSYSGAARQNSRNNLAGLFLLNELILKNDSAGSTSTVGNLIVTSTSPSAGLSFVSNGGVGPTLRNQSKGLTSVSLPISLGNTLTVTGEGHGNLLLSGIIAGTSPGNGLTFAMQGSGIVSLTGANTFTGPVVLTSGSVSVGHANAFGNSANVVSVDGGTLEFSIPVSLAQAFALNSTLNIVGGGGATFNGALSGDGGVSIATTTGSNVFTFSRNSTFQGPLTVRPTANSSATVALAGVNGALSGASSITLYSNSTLQLDNRFGNDNARISPSTPMGLHGADFILNASGTADTAQSVGPLTYSGTVDVSIPLQFGSTRNASLTFASLNRQDRGTLSFVSSGLGSAPGAGMTQILATQAPVADLFGGNGPAGSTTISILPYAIAKGDTTPLGATSLATYGAHGVRPLAASEYVPVPYVLSGSAGSDNVRLATSQQLGASPTRINALVLDTTTLSFSTIGAGLLIRPDTTLQVASGTLLATRAGATALSGVDSVIAGGTLQFGAAEGVLHIQTPTSLLSHTAGSNGLTMAGPSTLFLNEGNSFSGPVTINGGYLQVQADSALGDAQNDITITGGRSSTLLFSPHLFHGSSGPTSLTTSRAITLGASGGAFISALRAHTLELAGTISGDGPLFVHLPGVVRLTNANTYTGSTVILGAGGVGGVLAVTSDAALGNGGDVVLAGGTLRTDAAFSINRHINLTASSTIYTNGADLTIHGPISSDGLSQTTTLVKTGSNNLTLTANNPFRGPVQVGTREFHGDQTSFTNGGTLTLAGPHGSLASATAYTVNTASSLVLDNTAANRVNRLGISTVTLNGGSLTLLGGSSATATETCGALVLGTDSAESRSQTITIVPGQGQAAVLSFDSIGPNNVPSTLFVRGTSLGSALPGTPDTSSLLFRSAPNNFEGIVRNVVGAQSATALGATDFVAYDAARGVRLLGTRTTDTFAGNADFVSNQALGADASVNSMRLNAGVALNLEAHALTVSGGGILSVGGANAIAEGRLLFPRREAFFYTTSDLNVSSAISGTEVLTKSGPGVLTLSGNNQFEAANQQISITGGTLRIGAANAFTNGGLWIVGVWRDSTTGHAGVLDLNGFDAGIGGLVGSGTVDLGGASLTLGSTNFSGSIVGSGSLTIASRTTLSGISTFAGPTSIIDGATATLNAQGSVLGMSSHDVTLGNVDTNGILAFGAPVRSFDRSLDVRGTGTSRIDAAAAESSMRMTGDVTLNAALRIVGGAADTSASLSIAGTLQDGATPPVPGTFAISVTDGNVNFSGANTYSGDTRIVTSGVVGIGSDSVVDASGAILSGPFGKGALSAQAASFRADGAPRTIANPTTLSNSFSCSGTHDLTLSGPILWGAPTIRVTGSASLIVQGAIRSTNTTAISKEGVGTIILNANNTFLNPIVINGGAVRVNGQNSGPGSYTVNSGGILGGAGTIAGSLIVNAGGILEPGQGAGTLTTGAASIAAQGIILSWELGIPGALGQTPASDFFPTGSDLLAVIGGLTLPSSATSDTITLMISPLAGFDVGTYRIMSYTGTLTGDSAVNSSRFVIMGLPSGYSATVDTLTRGPGSGAVLHSVLVHVVPAPSTGAAAALVGLCTMSRRRRDSSNAWRSHPQHNTASRL